jgi:hypothetical protein
MKKKAMPKPRNPFVVHVTQRKKGAHVTSRKADRSATKQTLRKGNYEGS